jgi:hypothetical protein
MDRGFYPPRRRARGTRATDGCWRRRSWGWPLVPTIELRGLSDAQKRALVIADNKLAADAAWDRDLLTEMLLDLRTDGFDLPGHGARSPRAAGAG